MTSSTDQDTIRHLLIHSRLMFEKACRELEERRIQLDCTKACAKVYQEHGRSHPSEYGAGASVKSLIEDVEMLTESRDKWERAVALLDELYGKAPIVIIDEGNGVPDIPTEHIKTWAKESR